MNTADRLVAALRAAGIATGDAQARVGDVQLTGRYCVVWPVLERAGENTIGDPNTDRIIDMQITSVGPSRKAADQVAEAAGAVALGVLEPPDGQTWMCAPEYVVGNPTMREPPSDPARPDTAMWARADVYRYYLTPA
ncbi:hypothetical protein AB0K09_00460 [Streptomyces sp. NPDC049577]|uniref:hypothetical protein n=1 Tax=Streptomyces sp. NPDC049577 TaxID=3155153 RepID=UPI0034315C0C